MKKQILSIVMGLAFMGHIYAGSPEAGKNIFKNEAGNEKAIKDFHKHYKSAGNENWLTLRNVIKVDFITDNHSASAVYSKKGNWLYTIINYRADNLTTDLISQVKTEYEKYYISSAKKVESPLSASFYIVKLEGKDSYKTIKLDKDGIELLEDFKKG